MYLKHRCRKRTPQGRFRGIVHRWNANKQLPKAATVQCDDPQPWTLIGSSCDDVMNEEWLPTISSWWTEEEAGMQDIHNDITNTSKWPISEKFSKALLISPLPRHLECEICLDILTDPVQTTCCGQSYCKNCIDKVKNHVCPHCRAKLRVFPDKKSVRLINDLQIHCPYHVEDKCKWKGSPSELNDHLKNCDIKPITCPLGCGKKFEKRNKDIHVKYICSMQKIPCDYCQIEVINKDIAKHHETCPKMPLPCPNKCSSMETITRETMMQHIEVCPNQLVRCKYSEFGCNEVAIKRMDYEEHLSSTMAKHLDLVAEYAKNERSARMKLEEKVAEIERKVNSRRFH